MMGVEDLQDSFKLNDHDLLIKVFVIQQEMYKDVKELKEGTTIRLTSLERDKANKEDVINHEIRLTSLEAVKVEKVKELDVLTRQVMEHKNIITRLERFIWIFGGVILGLQFVLQFIVKLIFKVD